MLSGRNSRRFTIIALVLLTIALGAVTIAIGVRLQQDQAPDDAAAATCNLDLSYAPSACNPGSCGSGQRVEYTCECPANSFRDTSTRCQLSYGDESYVDPVLVGRCVTSSACSTGGDTGGGDTGGGDTGGGDTGGGTTCTIDNPSAVNSYIALSSGCPQIRMEKHVKDVARGSTNQSCVGTSVGSPQIIMAQPGQTYRADGESCGKCVQIDLVYDGRPYGTARYTGDCAVSSSSSSSSSQQTTTTSSSSSTTSTTETVQCGESCTTSDQCPNDHTCTDGTCQLNSCISGDQECNANNCAVLPDTGIFDGDGSALLLGMSFIIFGLILNRLGILFGKQNLA